MKPEEKRTNNAAQSRERVVVGLLSTAGLALALVACGGGGGGVTPPVGTSALVWGQGNWGERNWGGPAPLEHEPQPTRTGRSAIAPATPQEANPQEEETR